MEAVEKIPAAPLPRPGRSKACYAASFLLALPASLMIFPLADELDGLRQPFLYASLMPLSLYTLLWLSPRVQLWGWEKRRSYINAMIGIFAFGVFAHIHGLDGDLFGKMWSIFCFIPFYGSLLFTLGSAFLPKPASGGPAFD